MEDDNGDVVVVVEEVDVDVDDDVSGEVVEEYRVKDDQGGVSFELVKNGKLLEREGANNGLLTDNVSCRIG